MLVGDETRHKPFPFQSQQRTTTPWSLKFGASLELGSWRLELFRLFPVHAILLCFKNSTTLDRRINGDAFGPRRRFTAASDFSRSKLITCWLWHEKHCATSVPRKIGSRGNNNCRNSAPGSRNWSWNRRVSRTRRLSPVVAVTVGDTTTPGGRIFPITSANSAASSPTAQVLGANIPANSNKLCRNTRTSRRSTPSWPMSNAHRNRPSSISVNTCRVLLFKNSLTAASGTNGRREVKPKSNGRGTGANTAFGFGLGPER